MITEAVITTEAPAQAQPVILGAPTPERIDELCLAVDTAAAKAEKADADLTNAKKPLLEAVRAYGEVPANATKTKRLTGIIYAADSTVSTTTAIVGSAAAQLRGRLKKAHKAKLFDELFETTEKFTLRKGAAEMLKLGIGSMKPTDQAEFLSLFSQCFDAKSSSPSLTVQLCETLRRKEEEAEKKAAARAAKPAKAPRAKKAGAQ